MSKAILVGLVFIAGFQLLCPANINVSHPRGYYLQPIEVSISCTNCTNNEVILYTLNNSSPAIEDADVYEESINISKTTTLKICFFNGETYSPVIAHTYIFLKDVFDAEYMAQAIVTNYPERLIASFTSLPTISISTSNAEPNIFIEKDIATSVEIFNTSDVKSISFNCGIETWGGSMFNLKKHYRLEFKEKYGKDELQLNLFNTINTNIEPVNHFNRLLLRSASQDGLNSEFGDEEQAQFIRNRVLMDLQLQMGYPAPHGRFVQVFFNQQYIGVYHLMERPDADFFKDYYFKNIDKASIEVRKNASYLQQPYYITLYDELEEYIKNDLSISQNYQKLNKVLDLNQTAAYLLLNHYSGNFDYDKNRNNLGASALNNSYKFILWDVDLTLGNEGVFKDIYGEQLVFNGLEFTGPVPAQLLQNEEFKLKLADALYCNCFNNGTLTNENVGKVYEKRAGEVRQALVAESARWGTIDFEFNSPNGHFQVDDWWVDEEWEKELENTLNHFIENRTDTLIRQYKNAGIFPGLKPVGWGSEMEIWNEPIELFNKNSSGEIYYTTDGTDPRAFGGVISSTAKRYVDPFKIKNGSTVTVRVKDGNVWSVTCPKKIYIPQSYHNVIINEIHYAPNDSITSKLDTIAGKKFEFIELYNSSNMAVDLTDVELSAGIKYKFKKGTKIESKTYLVLSADSIMFTNRYGFSPFGEFKGNLSNEGEAILLKSPFYETLDSISYQIEFPWPEIVNIGGTSLSLLGTDLNNEVVTNWKASDKKHGTPCKINFEEDVDIGNSESFNEINIANLANGDWLITLPNRVRETQVEIYNLSGQFIHKQFIGNRIKNDYMAKGVYFLSVKTKVGSFTKKLIKL